MSQSVRLSVIVPICNVGSFLDECLESICSQTFSDIEILCLNDGSIDDSSAIMHKYAEQDPRIFCVDKENEGYGATCNRGLDMAHGEYIAIVEPDDYVLPNMFAEMLKFGDSLGGDIDIIKTPWMELYGWDNPNTLRKRPGSLYGLLPTSKVPFTLQDAPVLFEGHPSIWSALYRRSFLNEHAIRFHPYPGAGWADNPFLVQTLCRASSIAYLDKPFYYYRTDLPGKTLYKTDEKIELPFIRWMDMTSEMHEIGVKDKGIWLSHTVRAFNYIDDAIAGSGWENPVVKRMTRQLLEMLPEQYVLQCQKLSPAKKAFYFEVLGKPIPRISKVPYIKYLTKYAFRTVKTLGLGCLAHRIADFAQSKVRGAGIEKVEK